MRLLNPDLAHIAEAGLGSVAITVLYNICTDYGIIIRLNFPLLWVANGHRTCPGPSRGVLFWIYPFETHGRQGY
jgi:hypothetical protein